MNALPILPDMPTRDSRLRLTQRILLAAATADTSLLQDEHWQAAMMAIMNLLGQKIEQEGFKT